MIKSILSDLSTFKALNFHPGLNILLAEKSLGSTDKQSRNGAGKTSFVELIHFLFAADADPDSIFRHEKLLHHQFSITFELAESITQAMRGGVKPSKIYFPKGTGLNWPIKPMQGTDTSHIKNTDWKLLLGYFWFGLSCEENERQKYMPSFRTLFSYFARRENSNGFIATTKHNDKQTSWDEQVAISYLLGLDWSIPQGFQSIRDREKTIAELQKLARQGNMPEILGTASDLKTRLTVAEDRAKKKKAELNSFKVIDQYLDLEKEASKLTREINRLSNDNVIDRDLLSKLEISLQQEAPPGFTNLETLYQEAGVILPQIVVQRFDDVRIFHEKIIENRKAHLQSEIQSTLSRINERDAKKANLDRDF